MKKFQNTVSRTGAGFLGITALILIMLFAYAPTAEAGKPLSKSDGGGGTSDPGPVDCTAPSDTADADLDGFTDAEECNAGITLVDGITTVPGCGTATHDSSCLDPNEKDLFVILVEAAAGDVLDCSTNTARWVDPHIAGGKIIDNSGTMDALTLLPQLGVTVHKLPATWRSDRLVTDTQKAVRVTENLSVCGTVVGVSTYSTPNGEDNAAVFTQRIADLVNDAVSGMSTVKLNGASSTGAAIIEAYIAYVFAHEAGHSMKLVPVAYQNSRFGIYHWKTGSNYIMDQNIVVSSKGTTVSFTIPGNFADPSVTGKLLAGN